MARDDAISRGTSVSVGWKMEIRVDDLSSSPTQELLRLHLAGMHANTPAGHVFALDLSGLRAPGVTVWTPGRAKRFVELAR